LGRNSLLISYLIQVGINFICAESPSDNPMILQIKAAVGEEEARQISTRTKQALHAKRERGEKLGNDSIREVGKLGAEANKLKSLEFYKPILPTLEKLHAIHKTPTRIANELNNLGLRTVNNKLFAPSTVYYLIKRVESTKQSVMV
jgi:DNA invertase Pin-like site-specific DNA recombinase